MVAIRQIFVLCLLLALGNGSYYRRSHKNVLGLRKLLSELIHPKPNLRNHQLRRFGRFQNDNFNSDKYTRPYFANHIPSEAFGYDYFDPVNEQRSDSESQELGDYFGNSIRFSDYCEENHKNKNFKNPRSEEYDINEEYNDNYDNERINPDGYESLKKLKSLLCNPIIYKHEKSNIDLKEKDKQETKNEKENTDSAYFSNLNGESNISNELKTNNAVEKVDTTSQTNCSDPPDVNININPKFSIVPESIEQSNEAKDKIMPQNDISDQVFDNPGNNQVLLASNITPDVVPTLLPLNYPPYLSNLFIPNITPVQNIPPVVNPINNGAQFSKQPFLNQNFNNQQPGTIVPNDIMVPIPKIALTNADSGIANSYTIVAIPKNALYQNPYSEQQSYYVVQLKNGQSALLPSNNVQMFVRNNGQSLEQGDGQSTIKPSYDQIKPSNGEKPSTQDNAEVFVSNNVQQITSNGADGQKLSQDEKLLGDNEQTILNNIFGIEQTVVPANAQGVQKEGQNPLQFRNTAASASSSNGDSQSLLKFNHETDPSYSNENKNDGNDKLVFV